MRHDVDRLAGIVVRHVADYVVREQAPLIARLAALEARQPEKGEQGEPGPPGESIKGDTGETGPEGTPGRDGRDGRDAKGIDGTNGKDGTDGKDGLGFDDLDVVYDGERTLTVRFMQGERIREFPCLLPIMLDRGVYKDSGSYERGDAVTWAGSLWIAQEPTGEKPDSGKGWRLAVKRGRDGKDAPK